MSQRAWKIFYILMGLGTIIPLCIDFRISLGFLLGSVEALVHYKRLESFWNGIMDVGVSNKHTGVMHFGFTFALMAGVLLICAFFQNIFNIFACAVGMILVKITTYIDMLIPTKEGTW